VIVLRDKAFFFNRELTGIAERSLVQSRRG
jgi:hypothetical protein